MLPLVIENIVYSYLKDLECLKYKKINEELTEVLLLCRECDKYKLTMMRCKICSDDYCISCTYKNHYYINGKEYFNNHEVHCLHCQDSFCLEDYESDYSGYNNHLIHMNNNDFYDDFDW
tara:strand:- start:3280 stop:3636 length:357 start_codon:yes stop_codon:yes gene_type:complete